MRDILSTICAFQCLSMGLMSRTDEQAPIPGVFDDLVERLCIIEEHSDVVFNCQMGFYVLLTSRRGRTTTGMISTCLMEMILGNPMILEDIVKANKVAIEVEPIVLPHQHLLNGEFRIILQLIAVLQFGKQAKHLTDRAIDACAHVQNLRTVIYDYKVRVEACEVGSRKHVALLGVAINYLVRYFYLVVFADYLLENRGDGGARSRCPEVRFSGWLEERREIKNIVVRVTELE
jgi:hypothetical protein